MDGFVSLFINLVLFSLFFHNTAANEVHPINGMEEALSILAHSVSELAQKVATLENSFSKKLGALESVITNEVTSASIVKEKLQRQLIMLDGKLEKLDRKISRETSIIQESVSTTNLQMQLLSTKIEDVEKYQKRFHKIDNKDTIKRKAKYPKYNQDSEKMDNCSKKHEHNITEMVIMGVQKILPGMLASEFNQFYVNVAAKLDNALNQLHRDTLQRLRRVDDVSRKTLREVQHGRQDINHLTHIQKDVLSNISSITNIPKERTYINNSCLMDRTVLNNFVKKLKNRDRICQYCSWNSSLQNCNPTNSTIPVTLIKEMSKGGIIKAQISNPLWKQIFPASQHTLEFTSLKQSNLQTERAMCADTMNITMIEDVNYLLRTLINKSEDLHKVVDKQANDGVHLLKHLHQRFSMLMRKMNTEPNQEEALIAEIKELEQLVANSYRSILHAQNVFIQSCNRIQDKEPNIEQKIQEILSKFLTSMELGHQFNQFHLKEMKALIEQLLENNSHQEVSVISSNARKFLSYFFLHSNISDTFNSSLNLQNTIKEVESSEALLQAAIEQIQEIETEILGEEWKSAKLKDQIDQILTSAKDIKGLSKDQLTSIRTLQNNINNIIKDFSSQEGLLEEQVVFMSGDQYKNATLVIPKACSESLISQLEFHNISLNSSFYIHNTNITEEKPTSSAVKTDKDLLVLNTMHSSDLVNNYPDIGEYLQDEFDEYYHDYDYTNDDDINKLMTNIEV